MIGTNDINTIKRTLLYSLDLPNLPPPQLVVDQYFAIIRIIDNNDSPRAKHYKASTRKKAFSEEHVTNHAEIKSGTISLNALQYQKFGSAFFSCLLYKTLIEEKYYCYY